ncbi:hypothetical protein TI05_06310 [Achromatium sp. WMS3]|nr:hypothetical protein TI05_06310 [Achromatium sp. WMS3]
MPSLTSYYRYIIAILTIVVISLPITGSAKWYGLIIGINNYQYGSSESDPRPLKGAVNDAILVRDTLHKLGAKPEDIQLLTNAQATRDGFIQAWRTLDRQIGPDDTLWISFSGHGGQEEDRGVQDETDGLDETLLFYDFNPQQPLLGRISDDELSGLLQTSKAGRIFFLFDSCHAGGMSKRVTSKFQSWRGHTRHFKIPDDAEPPSMPLPPVADNAGDNRRLTHVLAADNDSITIPEIRTHNGQFHGALSWYWSQGLTGKADTNKDGLILRRELETFLQQNVTQQVNFQKPTIKPKADSQIVALTPIRLLWSGYEPIPAVPGLIRVNALPIDLQLTKVSSGYQLITTGNNIVARFNHLNKLPQAINRFRLIRYLKNRAHAKGQVTLNLQQGPGPHYPLRTTELQFIAVSTEPSYRALRVFNITQNDQLKLFFPLAKYNDPRQIDTYPYKLPTIWPHPPYGHDLAIAFACQGENLKLDELLSHHQQQASLPTLMEVHAVLNTTPCHIGWYHWQTAPNKP